MSSSTKSEALASLLEEAWRDHRTTALWFLDPAKMRDQRYALEVARVLKKGSAQSYVLGRRIESLLGEESQYAIEEVAQDVRRPAIGPRDDPAHAAVIDRQSCDFALTDKAYDSAVRFFPMEPDPVFGWRLHPVDAAVNKVIAAALRSDPKDVIDVLAWHGRPLSLGALAWAVPAKDPGLGPELVLDFIERARTPSLEQIKAMRFASPRESEPPSPSDIRLALRQIIGEARSLLDRLPPETAGCVFLSPEGQVVEPNPSKPETLAYPHAASQGGCVPRLGDGPEPPPVPPDLELPRFR